MELELLLHTPGDSCGIAIAPLEAGRPVTGLVLADRSSLQLTPLEDIPLAHKVAVRAVAAGQPVILYGQPIGQATRPIRPGEHVHTHNLKSLRWT